MLLGVATSCLDAGEKAPSMIGTAIVETNLDDVDVYIDGALIGIGCSNRAASVEIRPST